MYSLKTYYLIALLFMMVAFCTCKQEVHAGKLECLLESLKIELKGMVIEVGQHNGWNDTTSLIMVTYHKKSLKIPIERNLKGSYKGKDIYFYQSTIDSLDKQKYSRIPNGINWVNNTPKKMDEDYFMPPYDPINI